MSQASRLKREESFLKRLRSPFVVSCYGHEITEDKTERKRKYYNTILEYCPEQTLAKHIQRGRGKGLAEELVKEIARDVLVCLKYIHGEKIIHCDIKPKNILLLSVDTRISASGFAAKLSGFGKAMEEGSIEYGDGWGHRRGTTRFMSPELIRDKFLDYGADVWAFGCTVLEMLTGEEAWGEHGELDWEDWINVIGESDFVPYVPDSLSEIAKDFVYTCLEKDPLLRCSVDTLLKHPFLSLNHELEEEDEELEEEEEEEEEIDHDVEAYLQNREPLEQDVLYEIGDEEEEEEEIEHEVGEEEEEDIYDEVVFYDEIGDEEEEEAEEACLGGGQEEEEATETDEEYPLEDYEEDDL